MNEMVKYLEGVKVKRDIKNNRQLSLQLKLSYPSMLSIMDGASLPADDTCIRIAKLAGDDPSQVLLLAHKVRASDASKPYWEKIFKAVAAAALSIFLTFALVSPALAGQAVELANNIHYRSFIQLTYIIAFHIVSRCFLIF